METPEHGLDKGKLQMDVDALHGHGAYRAFRSRGIETLLMSNAPPASGFDVEDELPPCSGFRQRRKQMLAWRDNLFSEYHQGWRRLTVDPPPLVRHALGIPLTLRLKYPLVVRMLWSLAGAFTHPAVSVWLARRVLSGVNTYHGRKLVFVAGQYRWFTGQRLDYSPALDFVTRFAAPPTTMADLTRLHHSDENWVRAYYKLGARSVKQLGIHLRRRIESDDGPLVELLVDEGILTSTKQLDSWPRRPDYLRGGVRFDDVEIDAARNIVRRLLKVGASTTAVLNACQIDRPKFRVRQFDENVALLDARKVELSSLVDLAGSLLWTAAPDRWRFLLDTLQLHHAGDLARFLELLRANGEPSFALGKALVACGMSAEELAHCQQLLLLEPGDPESPIHALRLFTRPPFSLSARVIGGMRRYPRDSCSLEPFLCELARHGLTSPEEVRDFERCYLAFSSDTFGPLLDIAVPRSAKATSNQLATWVHSAGRIGQVDTIALAVRLLRIATLEDLDRLLVLVPLGGAMIQYLVEEKRLNTLKSLRHWFRNDASGVLELKVWGAIGAIERFALDDAFERRNFARVNHNIGTLLSELRDRVGASLGRRPRDPNDPARAGYDEAVPSARDAIRPGLLADARLVLSTTRGALFRSLLDATSRVEVQARLAEVEPLLDDLLRGRGPDHAQLSELEVEAIALVYETGPDTVANLWPDLHGQNGDLNAFVLADHYTMRWQKVERQLRDGARLEIKSLVALAELPALVSAIREDWRGEMPGACNGLRPSQFRDEADVSGLLHHLAVLCVLASGDDQVEASLQRWHQGRSALLAGGVSYTELEQLRAFIEHTLPDALELLARARMRTLPDNAAERLARQLGAPGMDAAQSSSQRLEASVAATLDKLQKTWRRWLSRERGKFPTGNMGLTETALHAVVSKSPSAFFARHAVGLCTRNDVGMWKEARHCHMLVFDRAQRRLAGMAMLYFEVVPAIHPVKPTLIIRALNPVAQFAAQHDLSNVVDSYFDTAIAVAEENDLAAVAFPGDAGDLMSNVPALQRDISKRHVGPARTYFSRSTLASGTEARRLERAVRVSCTFEGYAQGGSGTTSTLYAIWFGRTSGVVHAEAGRPNARTGALA